jgi:hypothetical protein
LLLGTLRCQVTVQGGSRGITRLIQKDADLTDQILANGSVLYVVARDNLTVLTESTADNPQDEQSRRDDRGDLY